MKSLISKSVSSIALLISISSMASSQTTTSSPTSVQPPREREWELTVAYFLGGARTSSTDLSISQPALGTRIIFRRIDLEGRSLDGPLYYGLRAGFFPRRRFPIGGEIEFIHLKVYANPLQQVSATGENRGVPVDGVITLGDVVQRYSISHGVNLLLVNAVARYAVVKSDEGPRDSLLLVSRAGLGPTIPHTESTVEGQNQEQYEIGSFAIQLAAGAELRLWRGLYLVGEYKFTRTRQEGRIFSGIAESLLRSHHTVAGLSYHF